MSESESITSPLRHLADTLSRWSRDAELFWSHRIEQMMTLEQTRQAAKDIVVWLELHGRQKDAYEVDDAVTLVREAAQEFDYQARHAASYPPDDPQCRGKLERLLETTAEAVSRLNSVDDELPAGTFEGFEDA